MKIPGQNYEENFLKAMKNKPIFKNILIIIVVAGLCTVFVNACAPRQEKRPVIKEKKCFECHPEFSGRFVEGNVHAPVQQEDCYACHRRHGLFGKIVFYENQPALCLRCHEDVAHAATDKSVHPPLVNKKCTTCHQPHNSPNEALLKAPGNKSCYVCHESMTFERKFVHQPVGEGCRTCHEPHSSGHVTLLKQGPDDTCKACHDITAATFADGHFSYRITSGCITCHTPHSATSRVLLKSVVHEPVRKGECDACHKVDGKGTMTLRNTADKLCLECHEITASAMTVHEPYVQGQCTVCHDAHASNFEKLLKKAPEKICLNCHLTDAGLKKGVAENKTDADMGDRTVNSNESGTAKETLASEITVKPMSEHRPAKDGKCLACHSGHTSTQKALLNEDPKKICFECHQEGRYKAPDGSHPVASENSCQTCHLPHRSTIRSLLKGDKESYLCFTCHKKESSERGKFSLHKPFARGECGSCHSLHRAEANGLLKASYTDGKLCLSCHAQVMETSESFVRHEPMQKAKCGECHLPHAADYDYIIKMQQDQLCFTCHQKTKTAFMNKKIKHQPARDGQCTSCHVAHGSQYKNILKKNQPMLCLNCHLEVSEFWLEGFAHQPAVEDCLNCHQSHAGNLEGMISQPSGTLCRQCHETGTEAFLKGHGQIKPKPDSCITCHSPHGSPVQSMLYPISHQPFNEGSCSPCHPEGKK